MFCKDAGCSPCAVQAPAAWPPYAMKSLSHHHRSPTSRRHRERERQLHRCRNPRNGPCEARSTAPSPLAGGGASSWLPLRSSETRVVACLPRSAEREQLW